MDDTRTSTNISISSSYSYSCSNNTNTDINSADQNMNNFLVEMNIHRILCGLEPKCTDVELVMRSTSTPLPIMSLMYVGMPKQTLNVALPNEIVPYMRRTLG